MFAGLPPLMAAGLYPGLPWLAPVIVPTGVGLANKDPSRIHPRHTPGKVSLLSCPTGVPHSGMTPVFTRGECDATCYATCDASSGATYDATNDATSIAS